MSAFFALIKFLWNNSSQVLALLEVLPAALEAAGNGMVIAGTSATNAGKLIRGNGTGGVNARQVFSRGADMVGDIKSQLVNVKNEIDNLSNQALLAPVSPLLNDMETQINSVNTAIQSIINELNDVSGVFDDMGNDLKDVGAQLTSVGNELRQIT